MRGVFEDDEEELEQEKSGRDTELTLGAGTLFLLLFGLVAVCGLCFGLGYALGHHAAFSQQASSRSQPATRAAGSIPKPSAVAQTPPPRSSTALPGSSASQPSSATGLPQATAAVAIPVNAAQPAAGGSTPGAIPASPPQVHPALPPTTSATPSTAPRTGPAIAQPVRPAALPPQNQFWVQIAAVSHVDDAEVLTEALRRRGYTVTPRREPSDNLIHVRVGPFATQNEAANWRMKLLNDGYNAMIQP